MLTFELIDHYLRADENFFLELAENDKDVVLDLRHVTLLDSSGIDVLLFISKRKRERGLSLKIAHATVQPRDMLERFGLLSLLETTGLVCDEEVSTPPEKALTVA